MIFYLPIVLAALATALYHVAQKAVPQQVNPMLSLVVNYTTALLLSLLILPLYPHRVGQSWSLRGVNWGSYVVGVSIVGVELAVLLAYRAGWRISIASVAGNVAAALLLVVAGLFFYHEHLSGKNLVGIVLCLAGLTLMVQR